MSFDKVVDSSVLDAGLKQIADAIREKGGTSDNLAFPTAMAEAIAAIESGGGSNIVGGTFTANKVNVAIADVLKANEIPQCAVLIETGFAWSNKTHKETRTLVTCVSNNGGWVGGTLYQPSGSNTVDSLSINRVLSEGFTETIEEAGIMYINGNISTKTLYVRNLTNGRTYAYAIIY